MEVVPEVPAVTVPLVEPMVAVVVLLLVHVPPVIASERVEEAPEQMTSDPDISDGNGFMVALAVIIQPPGAV